MNADLLLDNLGVIAAGPRGTQMLRELILQLAVQGRLGTQNTEDAPPNVDSVKGARFLQHNQDQPPYHIPDNWLWVTIPSLTQTDGLFNDGDWIESKDQDPNGSIRLIQLSDVGNGWFRNRSDRFLTKDKAIELKCTFLQLGDILISRLGEPLGKACIFPGDIKESVTAVDVCIVRVNPKRADNRLLMYFFNSQFFRDQIEKYATGTTRKRISRSNLGLIPFPLPPLAEQGRIVNKVDHLMALCDDLESRQQAEQEERRRLRTASLTAIEEAATAEEAERAWTHIAGVFGQLVDTLEDVAELRKAIVRLAVQGRLVQQDPGDEPAIESYMRIKGIKNKESLKKIEGIFNIPSTWIYLNFKDGIELKHGHQFLKPDFVANGIPVIKIGQCKVNGTLDLSCCDYIDQSRSFEFKDNRIYKDDILMALTGGTLGKVTIVKQDYGEVVQNYRVGKFIPNENLYSKGFTALILKSRIFQDLVQDSVNQNAQPNIGKEKIEDLIVPLPPLAEQHRIVVQVDRLRALCDGLEAGIRARDAALEAFAATACRAVLGGPALVSTPLTVPAKVMGQQRLPI